MNNRERIDKLNAERKLAFDEWKELLSAWTPEEQEYAAVLARGIARKKFGSQVFVRGIVEFSNICRNDCFYCGIRKSNTKAERYRLTPEEILACCRAGYEYGFRTFVLQSGEDAFFTAEKMADIVKKIKTNHPDCAVTLSAGERTREEYQLWFDAGADRYLLRHESADESYYRRIHPENLSLPNRMRCLNDLKDIGYQTGCGFMAGAPYQKAEHLAADMMFLTSFQPHMVGIGPFIPHCDTPFRDQKPGSPDQTLFLLSLCRILLPDILLPATTALGSLVPGGREKGILAGANVIMPNISPMEVRNKYFLYNNKNAADGAGPVNCPDLQKSLNAIGYEIRITRGDYGETLC